MTDPDDAEVWRRIRGDDDEAFRLLFVRHGPRIHRYLLRRTADVSTADDMVAVVFLEAWRLRHRTELQRDTALPWLYGVAGNVVRRWHRSRRRHDAALERLGSLPAPSPDLVEHRVEVAMQAATVLDQLRHLPRRDREVLALSAWEGLSQAEIAAALGISVGTVKSRLSRARSRLARLRTPAELTDPLQAADAPPPAHPAPTVARRPVTLPVATVATPLTEGPTS